MSRSYAIAAVVTLSLGAPAFARDCPELIGRWPYVSAESVAVVDGYGLVGGEDTIFVVDVSHPEAPRFIAHAALQGNPD